MAPTRARSTPPPPPPAAGGDVRRPAFHFPANDNVRHVGPLTVALYGTFAVAVVLFALVHWQII